MKKLLLFSVSFLSTIAFSQVTITQANMVSASDIVVQSNDTLPSVASPTGGTNQTWDYSTGLVEHTVNTLSFANPDWLINASFFPTANIAATDQAGFEVYSIIDAASIRFIGVAGDIFGTGQKQIYMNPADEILRFPANMNDSYTTTSIQSVTILGSDVGAPVDSIINKTYTTKIVSIDAWGNMTTPYGSFDVLRVNETVNAIDSTWTYFFGIESLFDNGDTTTYNYVFWSDDPTTGFPVAEFEHDNAGTVFGVTWLTAEPTLLLSENDVDDAKVYPNPTDGDLTIELNNNAITKVELYSISGVLVQSEQLTATKTTIDVSKLEKGVYFYKLLDNQNEVVVNKQFIVQ
ncbi:MAG: T9SS type A sorting domain-containing protein [Fluviicola sp.]|nr:T9SS type A sorting domain-containing protein [Fluviicola sp.]